MGIAVNDFDCAPSIDYCLDQIKSSVLLPARFDLSSDLLLYFAQVTMGLFQEYFVERPTTICGSTCKIGRVKNVHCYCIIIMIIIIFYYGILCYVNTILAVALPRPPPAPAHLPLCHPPLTPPPPGPSSPRPPILCVCPPSITPPHPGVCVCVCVCVTVTV